MIQGQNRRVAERPGSVKLRSDRSFSERIMRKYLKMRNWFPAMPQIIFGERAVRFFSLKATILLTIPVRILTRYSLFSTRLIRQRGPGPVLRLSPVPSEHLRSFENQILQNVFFMSGSRTTASSGMNYGMVSAGTVAYTFNGSARELSAPQAVAATLGGSEVSSRPAMRSLFDLIRIKQMEISRIFATSFADTYIRAPHRSSIDRILERQGNPREDPKMRHETLFTGLLGTPAIRRVSQQGRNTVTERAVELFFHSTNKIKREIDELKRTIRRTEDQIHEKVVRKVRELGAEKNRQVDIGNLTLQVYQNMERMIRTERERRGM
jgi:hypothetical protein